MAGATDIITYVGVPLAVLGVLPLLWNMFKAFKIRYQLERSIPKPIRNHFSLVMDPAAGNVSVSFHTFRLDFQGLLQMIARTSYSIDFFDDRLLHKSWMGLVSHGAQVRSRSWATRYVDKAHKFLVSSDMRTEAVELRVSWSTFVMIALDLGVDGYSGGLQDLKPSLSTVFHSKALISSSREVIMKVFKRDDLVVAHILSGSRVPGGSPRALAWSAIMVETHDDAVHLIPLTNRFPMLKADLPDNFIQDQALDERFATLPDKETRLALIWVLYWEKKIPSESSAAWRPIMPVPQCIRKISKTILTELMQVVDLEDRLHKIFSRYEEKVLIGEILAIFRDEWRYQMAPSDLSGPDREFPTIDFKSFESNMMYQSLNYDFKLTSHKLERTDIDLADDRLQIGVLARVLIAVSNIRFWTVNGKTRRDGLDWDSVPDPIEELLTNGGSDIWRDDGHFIRFE